MMRKISVFLAGVVVVSAILYLYTGYPLIMNSSQKEVVSMPNGEAGIFNPIENFDFTSGDNKAYLLFAKDDLKELPQEMSKRKLFECTDNTTLENLQKAFLFIKSSGDMATCESKIFIYKDGKLVFQSAFVLTDSVVGIQNSVVGWADAVNKDKLKEVLLKFMVVNKPVIKL